MNLVEAFNTKYFTVDFVKELRSFLETNKDEVIDIANARFVPRTMELIREATLSGVNIIDTDYPDRAERLKQIVDQRITTSMETKELPTLESYDNLIPYLQGLEKDVLYLPVRNASTAYNISLILLIQYYRPTISILIDQYFAELYIYLNDTITEDIFYKMIESTDEFRFIDNTKHFVKKIETKDIDKPFELYGHKTTWREVRYKYVVIPTYFGKEKIKDDPLRVEIFRRVLGKSKKYLLKELELRKRKKLTDIVKG